MIVGFDVSQTGRAKAGCGYVADSLIRHLAAVDTDNEYLLYPTFGDGVWDANWPKTTVQLGQPNVRRGLGHRLFSELETFWRSGSVDLDAALGSPDVVHSNNFFCPTGLRRARLVYTLHDLGFLEHPEWSVEENRLTCFGGVFNASVYADRVVAVSNHTRQHFLATFPHYPAERISVVYPASRFSARPPAARPTDLPPLEPSGFWLSVGTLEPRKNTQRLLRGYARLKAQLGHVPPLVLAGGKGWLMDDFERTIDDLHLHRDVILLGYVRDPVLQWLYENCYAFAYLSMFEGFGLPVVEAMSLGAAVISSNMTSLPEVVGDAGLQVDPLDDDAILAAMLKVSTGEIDRQALKERASARAKTFSWTRAAQDVREIYRELGRTVVPSVGAPRRHHDRA